MTLSYRVVMERYLVVNGVVGGSLPVVKSSCSQFFAMNKPRETLREDLKGDLYNI